MKRSKIFIKLNARKTAFFICVISAAIALFAVSYSIGTHFYAKEEPEPEKPVFKATYAEQPPYISELIVYDIMHRMANSKLSKESKDKSGRLDITANEIQAVKSIVEKMDYKDRAYVLQIIKRWENGDFTCIEGEHEYFYGRYNAENKK